MERTREDQPLRVEEIAFAQRVLVREVRVEDIASGTSFPLEKIIKNLQSGFQLIDIGCGRGDKSREVARLAFEEEKGGQVIGVDINPGAVSLLSRNAKEQNLPIAVYCTEVTNLGFASTQIIWLFFNP